MVVGVHLKLDHVVRHVVVVYGVLLECVIILHLHVEEGTAVVLVPTCITVAVIVVVVRP